MPPNTIESRARGTRPSAGASPAPSRVLHVAHGRTFGGIEMMLLTIAQHRGACAELVHEFAVSYEGRLADELRGTGAELHVLGAARVSRPLSIRRARAALRALLEAREYAAVIYHGAWAHACFAPVAGAAGCPVVFWQHGALTGAHWTERWAARCRPTFAICNSLFSAASLPQVFPHVDHSVVYCPVPAPIAHDAGRDRAHVRAEFRTPDDAVVVVQVSRMEAGKGHLDLMRALGALRDEPGWECWVVGGTQRPSEVAYEHEVRRAAEALGVAGRVRFCGTRTDVARVLRAADVFCQPSSSPEGFGIACVEALYAGLPVVATALGGALEIVDERCGILIPAGAPVELARALGRLITDAPLRDQLAAGGPGRARELCDPVAQLYQLAALLADVAAPRRHGFRVL